MINEIKSAFLENKWAIIISIAILFISLVLGYFLEPYLYSYFNPVVEDLTQKVQSGVIKLTFHDIFLNNLKVILMMFIYGIGCCISVLVLAFNGFFVGYYVASDGNPLAVSMYIIPHGIFEFSSCILACASGIVLFNFVYKFLKEVLNQDEGSISQRLSNSFDESYIKLKQALIIFAISLVLMIIAGFVEVYLTVPIAKYVISILG
ncbi:stage II sporulation protein M [Methanobrevibacter sp.]|uniref:stage II sporulation protein M n=1 Tax=Methanobrevibacter sp. TaxID=66852 RepID=UPI00388F0C3C